MASPWPPVVLLGIDRLLGLQLARLLWRRGLDVVGTAADPRSHYTRTRAARRIVPLAAFEDAPESHLASIQETFGGRPVVIPCFDEAVWWLDANRSRVSDHADFLLSERETLATLGDKARFYRHALAHGLPLPTTRFVSDRPTLESAARELTFPVVVKPPRRSAAWMQATNGFKVLRIDDRAALLRDARPLLDHCEELVVQGWVEGGDDAMYSVFVCLDRSSHPLTPSLVAHKLRQWPPRVGVGSLVEAVREDELEARSLEILQDLGYVGSGSMQWKRDTSTERFVLIEMNVRAALSFPLFEACGIEATLAHVAAACGRPAPSSAAGPTPERRWICWKRDLAAAFVGLRRGELTLADWLRSLRGRRFAADLDVADPGPLLADLMMKLRKGPTGLVRRLRAANG